jgi:hypothetical protein
MTVPRNGWSRVLTLVGLAIAAMQPAVAAEPESPASAGFDPMAQRYQLGHGLPLGDSGAALGGYATLSAGDSEQADWRVGMDSLSAFLWWDSGGRWHFFSEAEIVDAVVATPDEMTTDEADVELERFYVDYVRTDLLKFRIGKFLTPVGRWNLIHASPLVWTTARPLITERTFPTNATGLMVYGTLPWTDDGVEYSVYYSPGIELAPESDLDTFEEALGAHVSVSPFEHAQLGFSLVSFEQEYSPDQHKTLYGLDFVWAHRRWELSAEAHYRIASDYGEERDERGVYVQAVAPLSERLYAVTRYETFRRSGSARDINVYLGGLNLRLKPAVVIKLEYSEATDTDIEVRDGVLASLAVLF